MDNNNYYQFNPYTQPEQPKKPEKKGGFGKTILKAIAIALVFGIVAGGVFTGVNFTLNKILGVGQVSASVDKESDSTQKTEPVKKPTDYDQSGAVNVTNPGEAKELTDVSGIVKEVMPSIVAITNTSVINYRDFWGRVEKHQSESAGSGIILDQDDKYLYIATNNHVVSGAESIKVQFIDSKVVDAEVQGTVPNNDLAVVKVLIADIEKDTLDAIKVAKVGDSDALSVGEPSIAIGNALGYGQSVTTGIVSAVGRTVTTQDQTSGAVITNNNLIQTDAAINPGNSGGALLNKNGEVIGINSVKYSSTEVEGIGYAIAMADAMPILESLIESGDYVNTQAAYLGIQGGDVNSQMAAFNFPEGVYISSVVEGSGAEKAGIQEGDIITALEGKEIKGMSELQSALGRYKAGDVVTVTVARQQGKGFVSGDIQITLSSKAEIESKLSE